MGSAAFIGEPPPSEAVEAMYAANRADLGFVMNLTRAWANAPEVHAAWLAFTAAAASAAGLTFRQKGVLIGALAAELGDSYCSFAWGNRLASAAGEGAAAGVLSGSDEGLDPSERVLATWARRVVRDPGGTTAADVAILRAAGFDDRAILGLTAFVVARIAFATLNEALGAVPDAELYAAAPDAVRDAITWGRAPAS
jgi:alkylhydroperoxidase family enzyme